MYRFLKKNDSLAIEINKSCEELRVKMLSLDLNTIEIDSFVKQYFKKCHIDRVMFSLETSARILYEGITLTKKAKEDIVMLDYGAGLGTSYVLAKMIGVGNVIYNDLLPTFSDPARALNKTLGIELDEYLNGDIEETCIQLKERNIECDLLISRNVVEHIYSLETFFSTFYQYQPKAILYNSTTANWNNPFAHIYHVYLHTKWQSLVVEGKRDIILEKFPGISKDTANTLSRALITKGGKEFYEALDRFSTTQQMPVYPRDYTNICDATGNWGEHLLPYKMYRLFAPQYNLKFKPGFWDTNYKNPALRLLGKIANWLSGLLGNWGVVISSFVYIVCIPKEADL